MSRQFDAMSNHNEFGVVFAKRTKLGTDDNRIATSREMATHSQVFGMLFDVDRSGEANIGETSQLDGME